MDASNDLVIIDNVKLVISQVQPSKSNKNKGKSVGGRPLGEIWLHFGRKEAILPEKFEAEYKYCSAKWKKADTLSGRQTTMKDFYDSTELSEDFVKKLNATYNLPSQDYLSGRLFEGELTNVNENIQMDLSKQNNLTLSLDGWTSGNHQSYWNFIILTPSCKEYLYQLSNLLLDSHTATYLAKKIENILEQIEPERISAIVSDNAANVCKTRRLIKDKYPHIESVRCISHCINLIANNIVNHVFVNHLLIQINILASFFHNSHLAGAKFNQLIKESGIKGEGFKSYCKTRWVISSESVNSVLNLKSIIKKMVENHTEYLTNTRIKAIVNGHNFWADLNILAFILNLLRKAILALEARKTTLTDCFLNLT
ncbi:hypothetical protein RclHR1_02220021 [Rhizophagus clarus]|uniref:DUF659 domain-containing protein n=1 Tax=Rhizophagus clarus TaxID=94130 RepID=A0A2Z6RN88_9GLOM|nr:hypothetical protein RclHR1_02220021 [Rhizophagus clarus]